MKMSGERVIPAPQTRVWEALNDPEVLRQAIPGCIEMVKHSPTEFSAKVMAKVGPVKANFAGDVSLSELDPPNSYLISGKGSGGVAGFAEGGAQVRLEDIGGQTRLRYDVDAQVGGKLAQIGSRLIESTARRMAEDFFQRFADVVAGGEAQSGVEREVPAEPGLTAAPKARKAPAKKVASKSPASRKPAAKKSARRSSGESPQPAGFTAGPAPDRPPPRMAETADPASALPHRKMAGPEPVQYSASRNIWWIVGAGIAALLMILLLANA